MKAIVLMVMLFQIVTIPTTILASMPGGNSLEPAIKTFYVATNGNDQWSGTLPAPDSSKNDGPFATLGRASNAIRQLKSNGSKDAFTVLVRGGVYQLNETFTLGPEDSGSELHPLVFKAFPDERPTLNGARRIDNFKPYKGQIVKAELKGASPDSYNFRQLFAEGKWQTLARFPNFDPVNPVGGGFLYVESGTVEGSKLSFKYHAGSVPEWANSRDAEIVIFPGLNYWNNILPVAEIDRNNHLITLSQPTSSVIKPGNRFYFQNILAELDSPGEWYFDRHEKVLYFWPQNQASLNSVSIPVLSTIVEIKASKGKGSPGDIRFEGFTLEGCEGSAIVVSGAKRTVIARCTVFNAGGQGIAVRGGAENRVVGNDVYAVGGEGISISGGDRKTLTPSGHRAENNYVHHTGIFHKDTSGIFCSGVGNIISHNLIHSTPRMGIWFDGNDNVIEYNHVHHVNLETQDSGIIYSCARDWTKWGNVVEFNYLHDSEGYGRENATEAWRTPFYTWGIYLDDWSSGTKVYGNIVANTDRGGIFIHGGRDNIIENNVIIEGGSAQMVYSSIANTDQMLPIMRQKIHDMGYTKYPVLSKIKNADKDVNTMSGNRFEHNIICYNGKKSALYDIYGNFDFAANVSDYNIIRHGGAPILVPFTKVPPGQQWQAWGVRV